jgi:pyruvate/2-oxoacid:ferredoxin oxidoreductase alpha subunit/pyruvate/2-oxoacid:ferredoxin oxidoreductase beta subunit
MKRSFRTMDGNEAVASVAYRTNEVIAIYPITPASPMGEWADAWAAAQETNMWGTVPTIVEMQSEGGAAGAIHGALQAGALSTTFTASQGLLLMLPNLFKIAGELTSAVLHVASRAVATQGLSIFGDHSDVMATRASGFALFAAASVQEAMDFALIAQAATLAARIPFLHFFDGFRTSHEVAKVEILTDDDLRAMLDESLVLAHRARALSPDHPVLRGTAQNPDVFFQSRETVNPYYTACPETTQQTMDRFAQLVGRSYHLFDYHGAPDAERVMVLMGSGAETVHATVDALNARGEKVGVVQVRLYRPFDTQRLVAAFPATTRAVAVLDRTKEPGSAGEPLYLDCLTALHEGLQSGWLPMPTLPRVIGGRYGLGSKEFTPAMVKGIFDHLATAAPKNHFTVGIQDDVSHASLPYDAAFSIEPDDVVRALFYGLSSDGTVGANKNAIKIIGEETPNYAQGYFVYDSKKAGSVTMSHLRFGPRPIHAPYLVSQANFIGCHQPIFLDRYDMLQFLVPGGTFLVANATGCSSIYGGNLPTTPWTTNAAGRGPAWSNSLFEDNAEFGLGMRLALDAQYAMAGQLLTQLAGSLGAALVEAILAAHQQDEADIYEQRQRVAALKAALQRLDTAEARRLLSLADTLVKKSVWIIGGDGWAYDIGFGGLDHVLASGHNVNVLVLDTEVYSNTGGQMSKATPRAATAKFAAGGKPGAKKDLGLMALSYGNVYVASVAMGARDEHTLRAFLEAEAYDGPSLIIAYSHCIAHGINMTTAMQNQKAAVDTGQWLLYRYDPRRTQHGENPLQLDSREPRLPLRRYLEMETRFTMLTKSQPEVATQLFEAAQQDVEKRWKLYASLAAQPSPSSSQ